MRSDQEMKMSVSPICRGDDGSKYAYVSFEGGGRTAEGRIPSCRIHRGEGFDPEEIDALEVYMREHLDELKKMAAGINVLDYYMK